MNNGTKEGEKSFRVSFSRDDRKIFFSCGGGDEEF
jgi:hypothetical protein